MAQLRALVARARQSKTGNPARVTLDTLRNIECRLLKRQAQRNRANTGGNVDEKSQPDSGWDF